MQALLFCVNNAGISIVDTNLEGLALKEQYTKLFIKLQVRMLNVKPKDNSLKLTITEAWAINELIIFNFTGFELSTLGFIRRVIDQQIVSF